MLHLIFSGNTQFVMNAEVIRIFSWNENDWLRFRGKILRKIGLILKWSNKPLSMIQYKSTSLFSYNEANNSNWIRINNEIMKMAIVTDVDLIPLKLSFANEDTLLFDLWIAMVRDKIFWNWIEIKSEFACMDKLMYLIYLGCVWVLVLTSGIEGYRLSI